MSVDNICWESNRRYITAESFVRLWQTSSTVTEVQARVAKWVGNSGWLQEALDREKKDLADWVLRLEAYDAKNLESSHLNEKDVCALTGEKYQRRTWEKYEVVDARQHRAEIAQYLERTRDCLTRCERWRADPSTSWYVPTLAALQTRAARYRSEHKIPLRKLRQDDETKLAGAARWKALKELAKELNAA
jgi:hypothetical protein